MKCTWLGQAGLLFDFDGIKVMIDPYLSNSVDKINSSMKRNVEVDKRFLEERPDILILTHNHLDHTDPETLDVILDKWESICVLASQNAWTQTRKYGRSHNYVMFDRHTEWTYGHLRFRAVHAQHSDNYAIGVLILYHDKTFYITGDTLYHTKVIQDVKKVGRDIDVVFLPVNGVGNNMNVNDAMRFAAEIEAKEVVPIHFGLYDNINPKIEFICQNKVVPEFYKEIGLLR